MGSITRAGVRYDRSGRSLGWAIVVFASSEDANAAQRQYNGVPLDGKPMRIKVVELSTPDRDLGPSDDADAGSFSPRRGGGRLGGSANGFSSRGGGRSTGGWRRGGGGRGARGGFSGGSGRGGRRGGAGGGRANVSKEDLDKLLDAYVAQVCSFALLTNSVSFTLLMYFTSVVFLFYLYSYLFF